MESIRRLELDRDKVLEKWFKRIAETYPKVTAAFLTSQQDRFRNPVGHAISRAIGPIYDQVVSGMDEDVVSEALEEILKIRAVQDFSASEAVGFVFALKCVIRDVAGGGPGDPRPLEEIDARVDRVALLAFDKYSECRERLHGIRANEIRARSMRLLERAAIRPVAAGDGAERTAEGHRVSGGGGE
jgi:hypothetical protein